MIHIYIYIYRERERCTYIYHIMLCVVTSYNIGLQYDMYRYIEIYMFIAMYNLT